jgi:hypothetical protein
MKLQVTYQNQGPPHERNAAVTFYRDAILETTY